MQVERKVILVYTFYRERGGYPKPVYELSLQLASSCS
jgi:hypothetical protein